MSLTRRGKAAIAGGVVVTVAVAAVGFFSLFPDKAPAFVRTAISGVGLAPDPPPPDCPLTGRPAPHGAIPDRPALAVKVENLPEARPQSGLDRADVVYEEPVEGGITRFIAIFQCSQADRVGPVRSGRTTDPKVLVQYGHPVIGYAGGAPPVVKAIDEAGLIDVNFDVAASAYTRDPDRPAPHNLYTTTKALWKASRTKDGAPDPVFDHAPEIEGRSRRAASVHLPFSSYSDVIWRWGKKQGAWQRFHGTEPHLLTDGRQVSAANVVVMQVPVSTGSIIDAAGNASPEVSLTGSGRAWVFRDGRVIVGRWRRPALKDVTSFVTRDGSSIALAPGTTWVELVPQSIGVQIAK
ncbi:MAG TPA: DUF3048 domain-containing protein [Actinomycetota bacterium]|nr:DUF3048 domain-containing protein [Actinomycetota bacterium]